jgi:hypothetical protein
MEMSGLEYTCSAGESFDSVALVLFGDEKHASALLMANPELCHISVFTGGEALLIPVVELPEEGADESEHIPARAPWKE